MTHTDAGGQRARDAAELALVARAKAGGPREREELVKLFLPLIASVAHAYRRSTAVDHQELTQEGIVGLLRALERYEPDRGVPFWAYATWWVRQAMQQVVSELSRPMVLSDRALRQLARIKNAQRRFEQARRREATSAELAAIVGLPRSQVESLLGTDRTARGLDEPTGAEAGEGATVGELLADPRAQEAYERVPQRVLAAQVPALLDHLTERERTVIRSRYGLGERRADAARGRAGAGRQRRAGAADRAGVAGEALRRGRAGPSRPDGRNATRWEPEAMRRHEPRHDPPDDADPRRRRRSRPSSPGATYADLLDQLLAPIERCRREAQRRLDELARRRVAMTPVEREPWGPPRRAVAFEELARLTCLSWRPSSCDRSQPTRRPG